MAMKMIAQCIRKMKIIKMKFMEYLSCKNKKTESSSKWLRKIITTKMIMTMDKKQIQLTEQDLRFLVEDAVKEYMIQEGLWGGLKNLGQVGTQTMKNGINNIGNGIANGIANKYNKIANGFTNGVNKIANGATNAYNNVKTAYQQGSAQQDIQNVNKALLPMVQKGILGQRQYRTILGMLNKAIQAQGGQIMQGMA